MLSLRFPTRDGLSSASAMAATLLRLSAVALSANKVRTLLTTVGIVIGVATVILVISLGEGARGFILGQLGNIAPETLQVEVQVPSRASKAVRANQSGAALATGVQITTMKVRDVDDVRKLENVKDAYAYAFGQEKAVSFRDSKKTNIYSVEPSYLSVENKRLQEGRFFTASENDNDAKVAVLGPEIKRVLFGEQSAIGQTVKIKQQNFTVIGVMEELGSQGFVSFDEFIYIPLQTGMRQLLGVNYIRNFVVQVRDKARIQSTIYEIEAILRRNHGIRDPAKDDFAVSTPDEALSIVGTVTGGISILLLSIAAISLIVGGIGIMNVMYVTVTERTKEIGLKKAIGAPPVTILAQFLMEAVIITLAGGLVGIVIGVSLSYLITVIAQALDVAFTFTVPPSAILIAFGVSAAFGLIFGFAPAKRAADMNPIEALRYE